MSVNMSSVTLSTVFQLLENLGHFLDRAALDMVTRDYDESALVHARLAPDMVPLSRQVTLACEAALKGVCRLASIDTPAIVDKRFATFAELQSCIHRTLDFLKTVPAEKLERIDGDQIDWVVRDQTRRLGAEQYMTHWFLPNFSFHVTVAYAILRHNGVPLGKFDYLLGAGVEEPDFAKTFDRLTVR